MGAFAESENREADATAIIGESVPSIEGVLYGAVVLLCEISCSDGSCCDATGALVVTGVRGRAGA